MSVVVEQVPADVAAELRKGIVALPLRLGAPELGKLLDFLSLLTKWNRVYNLTAVRDPRAGVSINLLDCLAITPYITGLRVLDVGSGAGLPGIPLAIARPESELVLLESNHKKAAFLRQVVGELQLKNASVVCERAETWRPTRDFDCIVSRALAELPDFVGLTKHLLAPGGTFAAMKGVYPREEISRLPGEFRVRHVVRVAVPDLDAQRHLILIERA